MTTIIENTGYMAPEIIDENTETYLGEPVDTFAMGVTLFMMLTKRSPFA